jgi:tetratricopeptide (TPR) repeat protein
VEDWDRVSAVCDSLLAALASATALAEYRGDCGALAVARGRVRRGAADLEAAARIYAGQESLVDYANDMIGLALAEHLLGRLAAARARLEQVLARVSADSLGEPDRYINRTSLSAVAGLLGLTDVQRRVAAAYPPLADSASWLSVYGEGVRGAAFALREGEAERAVTLLRAAEATGYKPTFWEPYLHLLLGLAYEGTNDLNAAADHLERAMAPALIIGIGSFDVPARAQLPLVLRSLAEVEERRGDHEAAVRHYRRLLALWSGADPELAEQVASVERALARLAGSEDRGAR